MKEVFSNNKNIITNQLEQVTFVATNILNMKVMGIEIKRYQLRNTLIKLNYT